MTDTTQPEAIRLAAELDAYHTRACHKQAAAELRRLYARVNELEAHVQKPAAIEHVATDVSKNGPESNMPDLSQLTERGAKAWAGVDAQALREWGAQAPAVPAWKDHDTAKLVNDLRDVAIEFHDSQQLRERIAQIVRPVATLMAQAPAVPVAEDVAKELDIAREALQWYLRRFDHLQRVRHRMRDPERTMVCDILANGSLLFPEGNRYAMEAAPQPEAEVECTCAARDMPFGTCCKVRSAFEKWYDGQGDGRLQPFDVFKGGWQARAALSAQGDKP